MFGDFHGVPSFLTMVWVVYMRNVSEKKMYCKLCNVCKVSLILRVYSHGSRNVFKVIKTFVLCLLSRYVWIPSERSTSWNNHCFFNEAKIIQCSFIILDQRCQTQGLRATSGPSPHFERASKLFYCYFKGFETAALFPHTHTHLICPQNLSFTLKTRLNMPQLFLYPQPWLMRAGGGRGTST